MCLYFIYKHFADKKAAEKEVLAAEQKRGQQNRFSAGVRPAGNGHVSSPPESNGKAEMRQYD
jgi:hypothetical protein